MGKPPSIETQLKTARADLRRMDIELARANQQASAYRERATKAEQAVAEWKERFDILLRRDGMKEAGNG